MSNRHQVMQIIAKNPSITLDELFDIVGSAGEDRNKVRWTVGDCKKSDLITMGRDDVTGKPAYKLTDKGRAWMLNRTIDPDAPSTTTSQPEVEANNTGIQRVAPSSAKQHASALDVATKAPPAKAAPTAQPAARDESYVVVRHVIGQFSNKDQAMKHAEAHLTEEGAIAVCLVIAEAKLKPREVIWTGAR